MAELWYNLTPEQAAEKLNSDLHSGLDSQSVKARQKLYGKNNVFRTSIASFKDCVKKVASDVTTYLLVILAIMSAIFGEAVNAWVSITLLAVNFIVVLLSYYKSQNTLSDMTKYASPMSRVIRNGKMYALKQSEIVIGDIVQLNAGDIVPADARVIISHGLCTLESGFVKTKARKKTADCVYGLNVPIEDRSDMVFATSIVTEGSGKVLVCACGDSTYASITGNKKNIVSHKDLKILTTLKKYCNIWSLCMICMIAIVTLLDLTTSLQTRSLFNIFITATSLACATMTKFYVVFAYIIIGVGLYNLISKSKKDGNMSGAIIKNVDSIETIKDVDVIMVPKFGGFFGESASIERFFSSDTFHKTNEKNLYNNCGNFIEYATISCGYPGRIGIFNDMASEPYALAKMCKEAGIDIGKIAVKHSLLFYMDSFDNIPKCDCTVVAGEGTNIALIRGEAAPLLEHCSTYYDDGDLRLIDNRERTRINEALKEIDVDGGRAIALISKKTDKFNFNGISFDGWTLEGILDLREPVLPGSENNVMLCKEAGKQIIVLTDEENDSQRIFFKRTGIVDGDNAIVTSFDMYGLTDKQLREKAPTINMCEAFTIDQKKRLIQAFHLNNQKVAYLAKDLNEVVLLNEADVACSIGVSLQNGTSSLDLGAKDTPTYISNERLNPTGCEALKYASDIIVSPTSKSKGGFNAVVNSITASKAIYQNIMRMMKYLFTTQMARLIIVLYSVLAQRFSSNMSQGELLTPIQILFSGLIIDLIMVLIMAFNKPSKGELLQKENTQERLDQPLKYNLKSLIYGAAIALLTIILPFVFSLMGVDMSGGFLTSLVFIAFVFTQLIVANEILHVGSIFTRKKAFNKHITITWPAVVIFLLLLITIKPLGSLFSVKNLTPLQWLCALLIPILCFIAFEIYKYIKARTVHHLSAGKIFENVLPNKQNNSEFQIEPDDTQVNEILENMNIPEQISLFPDIKIEEEPSSGKSEQFISVLSDDMSDFDQKEPDGSERITDPEQEVERWIY